MALIKTKTLNSGHTGEYWKITSGTPDYQKMTFTYIVKLFKNHTFSKKDPMDGTTKVFTFHTTKEEFAGDLRAIGYLKIVAKANSIVKPAVPAESKPAIYGDADLKDAVSDV